jgi:hypothetical protein
MTDSDSKMLRVVAAWNTDGDISQHIEGFEPFCDRLTKWILRTRDEGIRKALIEMGWTPPLDDTLKKITREADDAVGIPARCFGAPGPHKTAHEVSR